MAKGGVKIKTTGMNEAIADLEKITDSTDGIMKQCVYMGAGEVADELKKQLNSLKTQTGNDRETARYPYAYEKKVLIDNMGIAPITSKGTINTKVGFDGYYTNKQGRKRPIPLLANVINAGSSFMHHQGFLNATVRKVQGACVKAMQEQLNKSIKGLTK